MLREKTAVVTGGSRGIGEAIVYKLAAMGMNVAVIYAGNAQAAEQVCKTCEKEYEVTAIPYQCNVADYEAVKTTVDTIKKDFGTVQVLVNNAGIRKDNLLLWMEQEDWDKVLGIGLHGFYNVTRPLLKAMSVKKRGRIVNMASVSGLRGLPGQCNYSAAKGGLIAATKALAQEVARRGITVNAVAPGFIRTDMVEGLDEVELKKTIPANRFGEAEEVAELVGFLVSDKAAYITGECISITGGLY